MYLLHPHPTHPSLLTPIHAVSDSQQQVLTRPVWVPDSMTKECMICSTKFSAFQRKHHCRRCGRVVCTSCSPHRVSLVTGEGGVVSGGGEGGGKLERTCRECFKEMTAVHNRGMYSSIQLPTVPWLLYKKYICNTPFMHHWSLT